MNANIKAKTVNQELILAAHRCNEIEKLSAAINFGLRNFEVDVHIQMIDGSSVLMIGHEIETATGQTFEDYMSDLISMSPDFDFLWLDMKDLNSNENEVITIATLQLMDIQYSLKNRVLVESRYIRHLTNLANEGWMTSYYCDWSVLWGKTLEEQAVICSGWLQSMEENNVDGISFDAQVFESIRDNFENKTVNGRPVVQYSWDLSLSFSTDNLGEKIIKYSHLSVLLITFSAINLKKTILDVEFGEGGTATNMEEAIESLPKEGAVNKIKTQYNSKYEKYEAIFDGTNFFYIPYTQDDDIGRTIKSRFTMELLFVPKGGLNPFSSMEYGGLGFEIKRTSGDSGVVEFWYNVDNAYVLPGGFFKANIQYGEDTYYHVFVTNDSSIFKMYVDGQKIVEANVWGSFKFPNQTQAPQLLFGIGADYVDSAIQKFQGGFIGKIVHAKIYNWALNELEIQSLTESSVPKLTMDVGFKEGNVATNFDEPIGSLPSQGSVNTIKTQFNSTYQKYEAIFDMTNFFYIPYTQYDAVGRSIMGVFSMELLFAPDGGINPFSSMEYGGLGFEMKNTGKITELSFWYNIAGSYVLSGNNFMKEICAGEGIYYHVFVTYDGNIFKMFIDGNKVLEYRISGPFTFPRQNQAPQLLFGIGADYVDRPYIDFQNAFRGKIIQAKIYMGRLSETAIKRITDRMKP